MPPTASFRRGNPGRPPSRQAQCQDNSRSRRRVTPRRQGRARRACDGRGAQDFATVAPPPQVSGDVPSVDILRNRRTASDPAVTNYHGSPARRTASDPVAPLCHPDECSTRRPREGSAHEMTRHGSSSHGLLSPRQRQSSALSSDTVSRQVLISASGDSPTTRGRRAYDGRGAQHFATVAPPPQVSGDVPSVDILRNRRTASDPIVTNYHDPPARRTASDPVNAAAPVGHRDPT